MIFLLIVLSVGPRGRLRLYLEILVEERNIKEYVVADPFDKFVVSEKDPHWNFYSKIKEYEPSKRSYLNLFPLHLQSYIENITRCAW